MSATDGVYQIRMETACCTNVGRKRARASDEYDSDAVTEWTSEWIEKHVLPWKRVTLVLRPQKQRKSASK